MSKQTLEIISIHKIELSTTNPRKVFDPKALEELSEYDFEDLHSTMA